MVKPQHAVAWLARKLQKHTQQLIGSRTSSSGIPEQLSASHLWLKFIITESSPSVYMHKIVHSCKTDGLY